LGTLRLELARIGCLGNTTAEAKRSQHTRAVQGDNGKARLPLSPKRLEPAHCRSLENGVAEKIASEATGGMRRPNKLPYSA